MQCKCFTCSIHRHKEIDKQARLFAEAVYYATNIVESNYQLRLLKSLGYKVGSLTDEGVEGEMAAIECDCGAEDVFKIEKWWDRVLEECGMVRQAILQIQPEDGDVKILEQKDVK